MDHGFLGLGVFFFVIISYLIKKKPNIISKNMKLSDFFLILKVMKSFFMLEVHSDSNLSSLFSLIKK